MEVIGEGQQHSQDIETITTTTSLNNISNEMIYNSSMGVDAATKLPVVTFIKALHLYQENCDDDGDGSKEAKGCPLLGIPLPLHLLHQALNLPKLDNNLDLENKAYHDVAIASAAKPCQSHPDMDQELFKILPLVHPSLNQLQPCLLLRVSEKEDYGDSDATAPHDRNCFDLLLLRVPPLMTQSETSKKESECQINTAAAAILQAIVEEINGEPMVGSTSNIIQTFTVSKITFVSDKKSSTSGYKSQNDNGIELPLCPVCRYRIIPERLGLPPLKTHQLCSCKHDTDCGNMQFLVPWENGACMVCHKLQQRLELSGAQPFIMPMPSTQSHHLDQSLQCFECRMKETLWICLTCGVVGCGRYSSGHAKQHFLETKHPFSLELATQRIWDYESSSFIQRDDLLNCPFMQQILGAVNRAAYNGAAMCDRVDDDYQLGLGFGSPWAAKKTLMIGEQYEVLLQSALADQAQHYEGKISQLQAELAAETIDRGALSATDMKQIINLEEGIRDIRCAVESMQSSFVEAQAEEAGHRAKANSLLREQGVMKQLLEKEKEDFEKESAAGQLQIEELEQQIRDVTANIRMREQIASRNDLNQAQIYGTSGEPKQ